MEIMKFVTLFEVISDDLKENPMSTYMVAPIIEYIQNLGLDDLNYGSYSNWWTVLVNTT